MNTDLKTYSGSCIYTIWDNNRPGRCYIGKTINYASRAKRHTLDLKAKRHANIYLQRLFDKGADLQICPLEICNKDMLSNREKFWVKFFKANVIGYNLSEGGETIPDEMLKWSQERKKRWSRYCSDNPIAAGTKKSANWKAKMAESVKRRRHAGTLVKHLNIACIVEDTITNNILSCKNIKEAAQIANVNYIYLTEKLKRGSGMAIIKHKKFIING